MADALEITVNGQRHRVTAAADTPLLYVLRDELDLNGPRFGCGLAQCGYCINGMIMTAAALLKQKPKASEPEIRSALDGNLCRCGTHMRILRAIRRVARA